jgi:very-short-patch-repair endonuclease
MRARHHRYARSQLLATRAAGMRANLNPAEVALWEAIRGRKLGVLFRRQVVLCGRYIADFYAPALRLVVEVDGGCHEQRRASDARRDRVLRQAGYRVLRLPAALVLCELLEAVARIRAELG